MKRTRIAALATAAVMGVAALPICNNASLTANAAGGYNYAEALQKALFFYQVQESGPLSKGNQVTWRADSMMSDEILGGWFDAGDHIKFTITNSYSSAMLAWGMLQFGDGIAQAGLTDSYRNSLAYSLDFIAACDLGDQVLYQIGDEGFDHKWWGSAEIYNYKREQMQGEAERPCYYTTDSNVTGHMAAALAAGYLVFKDVDATRAQNYLAHAKNCFDIANTTRDHGNTPASDSMYKSSHFYDELFWSANWLYMATGDQTYLDLCESDFIPNLGKEDQSTEMKYTWGMCWDDTQQGGTLLYAINTGKQQWIDQFTKHLEYWTTGYGGKQIAYTPDGLAWLFQWGSLRHATTTAFLAAVAVEELYADDAAKTKKYTDFYESQMNYAFGDNALGMSYVLGMGENYPQAWHHRTSSGVWDDQWTTLGVDKFHRHTLYGALIGGPGQDGSYTDAIAQYQYSEVAIDYNAGYTALLGKMIETYGGETDPDFPAKYLEEEFIEDQKEPTHKEFYMEAAINQSSDSYIEIKAQATNHSAFPTRVANSLSYRYFFDISELLENGLTIDDVSVRIGYDEFTGNTVASQPIHYADNIYYVEFTYTDSSVIRPSGQSEHQAELQFRLSVPDNNKVWDSSNDWSFQELQAGNNNTAITPYICMYDSGVMIWGIEPDGTTPDPGAVVPPVTDVTTQPNPDATKYGDVNCDGFVKVDDVILLNRFIAEDAAVTISKQGTANAQCGAVEGIAGDDAVAILQLIAGLVDSLPLK
ncbi:MAG: glycoside hydrolase family 9 protein [Oscillospiraceae bacterium]